KKDAYWAEQVDIQRQIAVAWAMDAAGKHDDALNALSAAADAEDRTEKHPVTPGPLVPARELYGAMLLAQGKASDALVAFEATLKKERRRLGAATGAKKSAEKTSDAAKARQYYAEVAELTAAADPNRSEAKDAQSFLAKAQ